MKSQIQNLKDKIMTSLKEMRKKDIAKQKLGQAFTGLKMSL